MSVDLKTLIDEVIVAPGAPRWITEAIKSVIQDYIFNFEANLSTLLDKPVEMEKR